MKDLLPHLLRWLQLLSTSAKPKPMQYLGNGNPVEDVSPANQVCAVCFQGQDDQDESTYVMCCYTEAVDIACCEYWYHPKCIGRNAIPEMDWICKECTNNQFNKFGLQAPVGECGYDFDPTDFDTKPAATATIASKTDEEHSTSTDKPSISASAKKKPFSKKKRRQLVLQSHQEPSDDSSADLNTTEDEKEESDEDSYLPTDEDYCETSDDDSTTYKKAKKAPPKLSTKSKTDTDEEESDFEDSGDGTTSSKAKNNMNKEMMEPVAKTWGRASRPSIGEVMDFKVPPRGGAVVRLGGMKRSKAGKIRPRTVGEHPRSIRQQVDSLSRIKLDAIRKGMETAQNQALPLSRSVDFNPSNPVHQALAEKEKDFPWVVHGAFVISGQGANTGTGGNARPTILDELQMHMWVGSKQAQDFVTDLFASQNDGNGPGGYELVIHHNFASYRSFLQPPDEEEPCNEMETATKKKRGRPKKATAAKKDEAPKKKRGHPKKAKAAAEEEEAPKKKRGRPKKAEAAAEEEEEPTPKRRRMSRN